MGNNTKEFEVFLKLTLMLCYFVIFSNILKFGLISTFVFIMKRNILGCITSHRQIIANRTVRMADKEDSKNHGKCTHMSVKSSKSMNYNSHFYQPNIFLLFPLPNVNSLPSMNKSTSPVLSATTNLLDPFAIAPKKKDQCETHSPQISETFDAPSMLSVPNDSMKAIETDLSHESANLLEEPVPPKSDDSRPQPDEVIPPARSSQN